MSPDFKRCDLIELRNLGVIQEANRLLFHSLGLALAIAINGGKMELVIEDGRDDPEGFIFDSLPAGTAFQKATSFEAFRKVRHEARLKALGYVKQPVEEFDGKETN